jgi:hypothetical protein
MKNGTGEYAWVKLSMSAEERLGLTVLIVKDGQIGYAFCEKMKDIQTGYTTYRPIPIVVEGKIES